MHADEPNKRAVVRPSMSRLAPSLSIVSRRGRNKSAATTAPAAAAAPDLPLEVWLKIIRYILDDRNRRSCSGASAGPVPKFYLYGSEDTNDAANDAALGDALHLWLGVRAVSRGVRAAVELAFQDVSLKGVLVGEPTSSSVLPAPERCGRVVQVSWFPYDRLATTTTTSSGSSTGSGSEGSAAAQRAVFTSGDEYWGAYLGAAGTVSPFAVPRGAMLAVWLPPAAQPVLVETALAVGLDARYGRRQVELCWRALFDALFPQLARRRVRQGKPPPFPPRLRPQREHQRLRRRWWQH